VTDVFYVLLEKNDKKCHDLLLRSATVASTIMKRVDHNDVEKLSRGQATKAKIGNRSIGHRLTEKERILFEAAKRQGYLKIPHSGVRRNVIRIYQLWCEVEARTCLIKEAGQ
jgi:hypothetical protein